MAYPVLFVSLVITPDLTNSTIKIDLGVSNKEKDKPFSKFKVDVTPDNLEGYINLPPQSVDGGYKYQMSNICTCGVSDPTSSNVPVKIRPNNKSKGCLCGFNGLLTIDLERSYLPDTSFLYMYFKKSAAGFVDIYMDTTCYIQEIIGKGKYVDTTVSSCKDSGYTTTIQEGKSLAMYMMIYQAKDEVMNDRQYIYPAIIVNTNCDPNTNLQNAISQVAENYFLLLEDILLDDMREWQRAGLGIYVVKQAEYENGEDTPFNTYEYGIRVE